MTTAKKKRRMRATYVLSPVPRMVITQRGAFDLSVRFKAHTTILRGDRVTLQWPLHLKRSVLSNPDVQIVSAKDFELGFTFIAPETFPKGMVVDMRWPLKLTVSDVI